MPIDQIIQPCLTDCSNYFPAPAADSLHFRFLQSEEATWIAPGLKAVYKDIASLRIMEIKGNLDQAQAFELPQEEPVFWLVYQYLGKSLVNNGRIQYLQSATYLGLDNRSANIILQFDRGKTWLCLIGISGGALSSLKEEYGNIAQLFTFSKSQPSKSHLIGYKQKRIFDKIQQLTDGAYSLPLRVAHYSNELIDLFNGELGEVESTVAREEVALYYRALEYIKVNFLAYKIPRKEIADHLCVHERTLTRAFEQKNVTISEMIQIVRLDKAREWIRHSERSIHSILESLHFEDLVHFEKAYYALYKVNPADDRGRVDTLAPI